MFGYDVYGRCRPQNQKNLILQKYYSLIGNVSGYLVTLKIFGGSEFLFWEPLGSPGVPLSFLSEARMKLQEMANFGPIINSSTSF